MAIDLENGDVVFDDGTTVRRRMRRAEAPDPGVHRDIDGHRFYVELRYDGDAVAAVHLTDARITEVDPAGARALHDPWLVERLARLPRPPRQRHWNPGHDPYGGIEYEFDWGTIGSYGIPQDMDAYIGLTYR